MDLTRLFVFLHVLGAFMFAAGHGVSMFVVFQARKEKDRSRLAALLDLSGWSLAVAGIGLLVILISGVVAGPCGAGTVVPGICPAGPDAAAAGAVAGATPSSTLPEPAGRRLPK